MFNKTPRILVVGDLMIDHYIWGKCDRISPEAPVQVINVKEENNRLGGACNVAANLISFGANVGLSGVIGKDKSGEWLLKECERIGINIDSIVLDSTRPTTQKSRILVNAHQVLRVDREESIKINDEIKNELIENLKYRLKDFDAIILSDYNKGVLRNDLISDLINLANSENKPILVDPKGNDYSKYKNATLLTPNKLEASKATNIEITDDETLKKAMIELQKIANLKISIVTLSEEGIAILDRGNLTKMPTIAKEVYDVTGAGDTSIAALAYSLSLGLDIYEACKFANAAAAVVVGKVGSATANLKEINDFLHYGSNTKIINKDELARILPSLKGKKIVFSNGCFDILHAGHVSYLNKAKKLGDVLILGLNSDESVKKLKGDSRPINNELDRASVLAGLESVDFVVIFNEETPLELVKLVKPEILVKGADYEGKEVVGSEFANEVKLIDFVNGKSTSNIINKIKG